MNVGSVIKYYRSKNGMTQAQLAEGICSISHLSKIESNTYIPHESTAEALLAKMGIWWKKEVARHRRLEQQLEELIDGLLHFDTEKAEKTFTQLEQEIEYLWSTDLVSRYELYKFRFLLHRQHKGEDMASQRELLERLKGSFTALENWLYQFFLSLYYAMTNKTEKAMKIISKLDKGIQGIPHKFEGEYYYQRARVLMMREDIDPASHYAELAVQHFRLHYNYIRLLHAQLLLAMNYTRRNLLVQASSIYETLKRNTRLTGQTELYSQTLYNLAELLMQKKDYQEAYELLLELKEKAAKDSYFYSAVLVSAIESAMETAIDAGPLIEELREANKESKCNYFKIYATYFYKRKFSQPDLYAYCEEIMFPFLQKNGFIKEGKKIASELGGYFRNRKEWEKADFYSFYYDRNGGETSWESKNQ